MADIADKANELAEMQLSISLAKHKPMATDWQFSATECEDCGKAIPLARRKALPGVQLCVVCQAYVEQQQRIYGGR